MITYIIFTLIFSVFLFAIGMVKALSIFERILFINSIAGVSIVIIAIMSSFESRASYLDIALIYALLNFLGMKAILNYHIK